MITHGTECPRCKSNFMRSIDSDAYVCRNAFCQFVVTGRELRMAAKNLDELISLKAAKHTPPDVRTGIRRFLEQEAEVK